MEHEDGGFKQHRRESSCTFSPSSTTSLQTTVSPSRSPAAGSHSGLVQCRGDLSRLLF